MTPCLDTGQLTAFSRGLASDADATAARNHLRDCPSCRARLDAIAGPPTVTVMPLTVAVPPPPSAELVRGSAVGRYLIHERVGVGGMGEVYAAVDPELGRKVAIKLVTENASGSTGGSNGQARLLREAQAMAQLAHPAVVTVFDVGTFRGGVFLAMEFVEGQTLRQWLAQKPRTWREILAVMLEAGRGLAAAHHAGLVHRDFKPDNVLIDTHGHARVTDFGLARATRDGEVTQEHAVPTPPDGGPGLGIRMNDEVTAFGAAMGTPGYMSPEQFQGTGTDGRTDQFSFCVTLYRALYGVPPFAGTGVELETNVLKGQLAPPPADASVPPWLREVVLRGLKSQPADRWPSMDALLEALERDPSVARRKLAWRLGVAAAFVAVTVGVFAAVSARRQVCASGPSKLAPVWNAAARAKIAAAFAAVQKPYAVVAAEAVAHELDTRGAQWVASYADACEATRVRGEQSEAALELRQRCLDERLGEMKALVDLLGGADEKAVRRAVQAVNGLETTRACADVANLSLPVRPPSEPGKRAQVDALRDRLAAPRALLLAGRFQEGVDQLPPLRAEALALGWQPLVAEVRLLEGDLLREVGKGGEAEAALLEALVAAEVSSHDVVRGRAAIALASTLGLREGKTALGEHWGRVADGILQRLGQPDELVGSLWSTLGALADSQGKNELAMERYQRSLAARARAFGEDSYLVGFTLNNVGITALALGDLPRASDVLERALVLQRKGLGEQHPALSAPLTNLGSLRVRQGKAAEGLALHEQAEAVATNALGPSHPNVGTALGNQAEALLALSRFADAETRAKKALAIYDARFPTGHPADVYLVTTLGEALVAQGRAGEAVPFLERGLGLLETNPTPADVTSRLRFVLAKSLAATGGDKARALELATRARAELPAKPADPALRGELDRLLEALRAEKTKAAPR